MHGLIPFLKPPGMTSHDAVNFARRALGTKRVGHAGTLDPAAAGVLPLAVGEATRLLQWMPGGKSYVAEASFGYETTTLDAMGETVSRCDASQVSAEKIAAILPRFVGSFDQIPPLYSAIKTDGKKGYERARDGEDVELAARRVEVFSLQLTRFENGETPRARFDIACGAGFYVRSLVRDIGRQLGCGATMTFLVRSQSSGFALEKAATVEELEAGNPHSSFVSFDTALDSCATTHIEDDALIGLYLAGKGAWREQAHAKAQSETLLVRSPSRGAALLWRGESEISTFFWQPKS
ncbi:MAG TPA: tRNA pseudouridine(55) synthase TruB [Abditibacteriaceae bacterium]|jgi:tRNA pseudouridine55 synthase